MVAGEGRTKCRGWGARAAQAGMQDVWDDAQTPCSRRCFGGVVVRRCCVDRRRPGGRRWGGWGVVRGKGRTGGGWGEEKAFCVAGE